MKLLLLSDLHVEFASFDAPSRGELGHDAVILAGDIYGAQRLVSWARRESQFGTEVPIIVVTGNHEFYGHAWQPALARLMHAAQGTNVHVLDRDELQIGDVRFLGATLWTDFALHQAVGQSVSRAMADARRYMNDYAEIRHAESDAAGRKPRLLRPEDVLQEHLLSRRWLLDRLTDGNASKTVVVTHHAPSAGSILRRFEGDSLNPCFVSELGDEFFDRATLWIHGHTHDSADYRRGRTRVLCNPRGYRLASGRFENGEFDPRLVVEV